MRLLGKRYISINDYFKSRFNRKIRKISLNIGFSCPNRDGSKGYQGCIFCSEKGSASKNSSLGLDINNQIKVGRSYYKKKYINEGFIAYFQAFTSTYGPIDVLERAILQVSNHPDIIGIAISTRPDCLHSQIFDLIDKYRQRFNIIWIELGLQTIHQKSYKWMNRQDNLQSYTEAVSLANSYQIPIVAHVILGIPIETVSEMVETAIFFQKQAVWGVKIHQLHAIPGTKLWNLFKDGSFNHLLVEEYLEILITFLEFLPPDIIIHRLIADFQNSTLIKKKNTDTIESRKEDFLTLLDEKMAKTEAYQGKKYLNSSS